LITANIGGYTAVASAYQGDNDSHISYEGKTDEKFVAQIKVPHARLLLLNMDDELSIPYWG